VTTFAAAQTSLPVTAFVRDRDRRRFDSLLLSGDVTGIVAYPRSKRFEGTCVCPRPWTTDLSLGWKICGVAVS